MPDKDYSKVLIIRNKLGLHARAAAVFVRTSSKFDCDVKLRKDGYEVNGKSIIGVMTLAAEEGSTLLLRFDGEDEKELSKEMVKFFKDGFGEM